MEIEAVGLVYMLLLRNISDYILQKLGDVTLDFKFKKKEKGKSSSFVFECLLYHLTSPVLLQKEKRIQMFFSQSGILTSNKQYNAKDSHGEFFLYMQ